MFFQRILSRLPSRTRPLVEAGIYGLGAGLASVAFEIGTNWLYGFALVRLSHGTPLHFVLISFVVVVGTALLSGMLLARFGPDVAGSGIPQLKLAFWKDFGYIPWRVAWVKLVAGVLAVGGGSSLGREGPSVQLAGAVASNLSGFFGTAKSGRRRATAAGAAAGLAATFNTPLAAIAFVLEEVLGDLNSNLLGSVVVASVVGAFVVHAILGSHPAFALPTVNMPTWNGRLLVPVVALLASLIGVYFQRGALGLRQRIRHTDLNRIPLWARPACGAFFTWTIGVGIFLCCGRLGVFSLGYDDLMGALDGQVLGFVPWMLLGGKLAATIFSYGSGGCGGVFAPSLFLGAMTGCGVEELVRVLGMGSTSEDRLLLIIIGMSSCLGAVVRAPFTSILIVFEMTREFALIPALLVAGILSQALCRWMEPAGFYEKVIEDEGHELSQVMPPRDFREWGRYPVSAIANYQPALITDLEPETLHGMFGRVSYSRLVYQQDRQPPGLVLRDEALKALQTGGSVPIHAAPTCQRGDAIVKVQRQLVDSLHGIALILDADAGVVVGLVTLHDLLRAQQQFAAQNAE